MPRITNQAVTLRAQYDWRRNSQRLNATLQRLSTGLRINRAADDPAGVVAADRLANQAAAIDPAIDQAQRADNLLATADGALAQIAELLLSIKQLTLEAANTATVNGEQLSANQLAIDAAIGAIGRLAQSTTFAGRRLLDGSLGYTVSAVDPAAINALGIARANLANASCLPVRVELAETALPATLQFRAGQVDEATHLRIAGRVGTETLSFEAGTPASAMLIAINQAADATGVSASLLNPLDPASGLQLTSRQIGSAAFVSVEPLNGTFATTDPDGVPCNRRAGRDAVATINGLSARADGMTLSLSSADLELTLWLADGMEPGATAFAITGGGSRFVAGPSLSDDVISLSIGSVAPADLGCPELGFLSELMTGGTKSLAAGGARQAAAVVEHAIQQVSMLRGRLGTFAQQTLAGGIDAMTLLKENVLTSESTIRDADFAVETSALARAQLLSDVAASVMAIANSSREAVLRLLS